MPTCIHLGKEDLRTGLSSAVGFPQEDLEKWEAARVHVHRSELHSTGTVSLLASDLLQLKPIERTSFAVYGPYSTAGGAGKGQSPGPPYSTTGQAGPTLRGSGRFFR